MEKLQELKEYLKKIEYLNSAVGVLGWDMRTNIPKKGTDYRADVIAYLSTECYKLQTADKVGEFVEYFKDKKDLNKIDSSMIKNLKKEYERVKKIPEDRFTEYTRLQSVSEEKWEEAKEKNDFSIFAPYLEKIINFTKELIGYWGYEESKYDTLLDMYEPGITSRELDKVFGELRDAIVTLLNKIKDSKENIDSSFLNRYYSKETQMELGEYSARVIGYDMEAGRIDESVHPFTTEFCNKDVRITTSYDDQNFLSNLFSCIHEGGHAIYEQNIPDDLYGTCLAHGVSMGVHESQSRLYENIIGRSYEFWSYIYPEIIRIYPEFKDVSLDKMYKAVNKVMPSLIRVDADELTYSIHVIIRYEIEKMIINGDIDVKDLPRIWNEKYKEYLGVEPKDDAEGILQDMHWSDGSFGYFPSYALGNLYGAQFLNKMKKDIPNIMDLIKNGDMKPLYNWLKENIHKHGSVYTPQELIKMVTGEELSAKYFIEYLNDKYSKIYNI